VALPHTVGFVDPLFSTGIAQSLNGIEKITGILDRNRDHPEGLKRDLKEYEHAVFEELKLIDLLVAGCYKTMAHFDLFNAWSMLYFAATIACEQSLMQNKTPGYFLGADDSLIRENVQESYADLLKITDPHQPSREDIRKFTRTIEKRIKPLNTAGLLDPSFKNMYRHTAARL
jgi:FADH2 O2-dependent halogenase